MKIKLFATLFTLSLLLTGSPFTYSQMTDERIKTDVARRGTGEGAKVTVTTKGGIKSKGYITRADAETFDLRNQKTAQIETFSYADVVKVQKPGWSKAAKIGLGVGIGVAVTGVILAIGFKNMKMF